MGGECCFGKHTVDDGADFVGPTGGSCAITGKDKARQTSCNGTFNLTGG